MVTLLLSVAIACSPAFAGPPDERLDASDVAWASPSEDASGSMPLGNGVVGVNAWIGKNGDVQFYISRVDSWSECERLLKLARVRITFKAPMFEGGLPSIRQDLFMRGGRIEFQAEDDLSPADKHHIDMRLYLDPDKPLIVFEASGNEPFTIQAKVENWRTKENRFESDQELESAWAMRGAPRAALPQALLAESADVFVNEPAAVACYHRNERSIVPLTLHRQGLDEIAATVPDPLRGRTFGVWMQGDSMVSDGPTTLRMKETSKYCQLRVVALAEQCESADDWVARSRAAAGAAADVAAGSGELPIVRTSRWWRSFWDRSWIFASADSSPAREECELITRAYALQRFIFACSSRGSFPPKFNGSIFTVEPKFTEGQPFNADWRKWGGSYWWQNTRLPYYPMLAAGDFDLMHPLFDYYERCLPACRARAKLYYNADGVYFPETMTAFATYANGDYGWKREGLDRSDISPCPWWKWAWQQGLELSQIMLDYAAYTGDDAFLREHAIPMASESLRYYDSRFKRDEKGKLIISPTQVIETYWSGVVNDTPSVAGLHSVCDQLLALPESVGSPEDRALWKRMKAAAPDLPLLTKDGATMCAPAEKFDPKRTNCETPELYSVFPFRLYGIGRPNIDRAIAAYHARHDKATVGWTQDGMFAAMLGLTEEAKAQLLAKCRNSNKNFRFPAMWGPNFDWLPDQCHGANLMSTLQLMLMQCDGDKIYLLPAWPKEWNVSFKLHAPRQTTVECVYRAGKVESLTVSPDARRADVVMPP